MKNVHNFVLADFQNSICLPSFQKTDPNVIGRLLY